MVRENTNNASQSTSKFSKKLSLSCLNDDATDIYNSEAAQNAFFNAPKVTRRQFTRKGVSKACTDDEEEPEQQYDEHNDVEVNAKITGFMQEFISKKITANNAFETQIFEKLNNVVEVESLKCVGTMLDASARVYAFRVDNTHGECFTVRTKINESKKKDRAGSDDPKNLKTTNKDVMATNNPDEEDDFDQDEQEDQKPKRTTQKRTRQKESNFTEQPGHIEDLLKRAASLAERFAENSLVSEVIDEEALNAGFEHYVNQMEDLSVLRRIKIPFVNERAGNINRSNDEYGIDDPIYHKVAKEFEEGCAQSFVNNEVLTNPTGSFLILHTNWKNNEPCIAPKAAEMSTRHDPIFDQLEGSLERALSREPCSLTLLEAFCENDSDEEDNSLDDIRMLGRPSQAVNEAMHNQQCGQGEPLMENDTETSSVVSNITEEDKSRKAYEEIAKFQVFFDDQVERPINKNPFDGEDFFNKDFSELMHPDTNEFDVQIAAFHSFTDDDAAVFGIPLELMARIKKSLKLDRVIPEDLQQKLFDVMGSENRRRLEIVLETKHLTKKEGAETGTEIVQPLDFFMTRFAPLIDSVWHATIKKASEEQLSMVGFNFGPKGIQRSAMRLDTSAMKSTMKKRVGPYVTPLKTPVRPSPLVTPESKIMSPHIMSKSRLTTKHQKSSSERKKPVSRLKFSGAASSSKMDAQAPLHEISDEDNMNPDISPVRHVSTASTTLSTLMGRNKNYVYFLARPREYPRVYTDQVIDPKDNPMQSAELLDMDEVLGLNEEGRLKRSTFVKQPSIKEVNPEPMDEMRAPVAKELLETVDDAGPAVFYAKNDDPFNHSVDFGDELQLDIEEPMDQQLETVDNETVQLAEKFRETIDILDILNQPVESIEEELSDVCEEVTDVNATVMQDLNIEDDSHWKGAPKAIADQSALLEAEAAKKLKKSVSAKLKRHKVDLYAQEEKYGNTLEGAISLEKVHALNGQFKTSLLTKLPDDGKVDVVGTANFSDVYDPTDLISRSLLYKRKSGYWKNTMSGPEYVQLRSGYALRTVEEEVECVDDLTVPGSKKKKLNNAPERRNAQKISAVNLQEVFSDMKDEASNFYDVDISPRQMRSISPFVNARFLGDDKDEQLEFNGGIIRIRQSRVKPPMVKRAIASILASKEADLNAMQSVLGSSPVKNGVMNDIKEDSNSDDENDDVLSDESDEKYEEEELGIVDVQNGLPSNFDPSTGFEIQGDHHFSNLCAYLPGYLSGQTKKDLNVINTFAITLIMCNEHSLRLVQKVDPQTELVSEDGMADFKIVLAK